MPGDPRPIGVFDSGMGGLTVLRALVAKLPNERFVYLGDTARLPYGTKSAETVQAYALQATRLLLDQGVKMLVIACNTASAVSLYLLQEAWAPIPVIGVIEPGARAGVAATRNRRIAVIATGGLSHWPGEAKHGKINIPFDKKFLDTLTGSDRGRLTEYSHDEINREAGSGGHEIRTWIALAGAVQNWQAELLAYEPVVPWATGCGLVAFSR